MIGLISGGKDSILNLSLCLELGYTIKVLGHIRTSENGQDEQDSYMYQSVGSSMVPLIAECLEIPLVIRQCKGRPINVDSLIYEKTVNDEVEDLYELLKEIKESYPDVKYVSTGAIWSNYQRERVENICKRLSLISVPLLWRMPQLVLLDIMARMNIDARIIKIASMGLTKKFLNQSVTQLRTQLKQLESQYGASPCGEGGEYETLVVDCPLYRSKRLHLVETTTVLIGGDEVIAPVAMLRIDKAEVIPKKTENDFSFANKWSSNLMSFYFRDTIGDSLKDLLPDIPTSVLSNSTTIAEEQTALFLSLSLWRAVERIPSEWHRATFVGQVLLSLRSIRNHLVESQKSLSDVTTMYVSKKLNPQKTKLLHLCVSKFQHYHGHSNMLHEQRYQESWFKYIDPQLVNSSKVKSTELSHLEWKIIFGEQKNYRCLHQNEQIALKVI